MLFKLFFGVTRSLTAPNTDLRGAPGVATIFARLDGACELEEEAAAGMDVDAGGRGSVANTGGAGTANEKGDGLE